MNDVWMGGDSSIEEAVLWSEARLRDLELAPGGPWEMVHRRPWSTVLGRRTDRGTVYFKALLPSLRYEAEVAAALATKRPDCTLRPLAVETSRGWLLLPDGGSRLREIVGVEGGVAAWESLLPVYAGLQIDLAPRIDDLIALGLPDRRLEVLPDLFDALLADERVLAPGRPHGLSAEQVEELRHLASHVRAACTELAGYGIPDSLDHGDLTDGNVFIREGLPIFFDWSDACAGHPFFSLRTALVSVEISLNLDEGSAPLAPLRDAYLRPWEGLLPGSDLRAAFDLARRLWAISGALKWWGILAGLNEGDREEYAYTVPALLEEVLAANL